MYVRFWGTRGSIAAPGRETSRFGGNTSCVELRASDGTVIVLDCGTGARELGLHLLEHGPRPLRVHLLIGHTHWDHIQGFPFFAPAFMPGVEVNIHAPLGFQKSLGDAMAGQMESAYFPVKLKELRSRIHFTELDEGFFRVGDVLVETQYVNHTAPTIAYRLTNGATTVAYVTDHEPFWIPGGQGFLHPGDQRQQLTTAFSAALSGQHHAAVTVMLPTRKAAVRSVWSIAPVGRAEASGEQLDLELEPLAGLAEGDAAGLREAQELLPHLGAHPDRIERAKTLGADLTLTPGRPEVAQAVRDATEGRGADAAILTAGGPRAFTEAIDLLRDGGVLVLFSSEPGHPRVDLDMHRFFYQELSIVSSYSPSPTELKEALVLLADRTVRVKELITHRVSLADLAEGMRLFRDKKALKVFVEVEYR